MTNTVRTIDLTDDRRVQHDRDVRRNEHARELFALARLERRAEAEVRQLDRRLRELGEQHDRTARWLETEYRRTHFGKPPVSWPGPDASGVGRHGPAWHPRLAIAVAGPGGSASTPPEPPSSQLKGKT
jgi:hypothetical protein